MVKVTENWAATLRAMKVGDIVVFPVRAISSVNTTISRLRLEMFVVIPVRMKWTIKAQKRDIYKKLGISKDTELVLYMFCERMKINFDIKEIRKHGLELFFSILFLVIAALDFHPDMRQCSRAKTRTTQVSRTRRTKTDSDYELYS